MTETTVLTELEKAMQIVSQVMTHEPEGTALYNALQTKLDEYKATYKVAMLKHPFEVIDDTMRSFGNTYDAKNADTVTVRYTAENGTIFRKYNVKWYEMSEAFSELSRRAYEEGTSVHHVIVY